MRRGFRVPPHLEIIAKDVIIAIINKIPNDWKIVRGGLRAPQHMLDSGEALSSTEVIFDDSIKFRRKKDQVADVPGFLFGDKYPGEVDFGNGFGYCEVMPMEQSKITICRLLTLGYRGRLRFKYAEEGHRDKVSFSCNMWLPPAAQNTEAFCTIESNCAEQPEYGRTIAPLIAICEDLKMQELEERK